MDESSFNATSQFSQMHQEMMELLRAELRGEIELLHQANYDLKHECKILKEKQLRDRAMISQLQEEVNALQRYVRRAKYLELVKNNKNWRYPLDIPGQDELLSLGYDEDESLQIVESIDDVKDITIKMRRGERIFNIDPHGTSQFYEEMIPHFKEFADALIEYQHTINYMEDETFSFSLGSVALSREVLDVIQHALQRTHFHILDFYSNEIHGVGYMKFITNCVTADTKLKCLDLNGVVFENTEDIDLFCAAVSNHDSLPHLMLDNCEMAQGGLREIFNKLKSPTLEILDFRENVMMNLNPRDLTDLLLSNPSLSKLDLRWNPFNEQDIVYISDALRNNTSLHELKLGFDDLRVLPDNWDLLASVVFDGTSVNSAHDSNHHCHLQLSGIQTYQNYKFNKYKDPVLNRRKKIYHILSTRNRNRENAAHFESENIGIKHMPRILALLKPFSEHHLNENGTKEDDEVGPLSIAYEIMRDWKMPELYNYLDVMEENQGYWAS